MQCATLKSSSPRCKKNGDRWTQLDSISALSFSSSPSLFLEESNASTPEGLSACLLLSSSLALLAHGRYAVLSIESVFVFLPNYAHKTGITTLQHSKRNGVLESYFMFGVDRAPPPGRKVGQCWPARGAFRSQTRHSTDIAYE